MRAEQKGISEIHREERLCNNHRKRALNGPGGFPRRLHDRSLVFTAIAATT
jgi:hypothetical protein